MKATGIVRRIDDLGRVVIPKEIRRTMRIREGEPLEIYTNTEGEVIFKKYSPVGEMLSTATQYAEVLSKGTPLAVLICDRDHCIACAGVARREFLERRVSPALDELMEERHTHISKPGDGKRLMVLEGIDRSAAVAVPILSAGDVIGAVVLLTPESGAVPSESDIKLTEVAAAFLGCQTEE
ncbi:MAG: AbrB/MazE/SpoVT family DNA-binding domain-containing protein [Clostridia bacterium]|nr:AbrB/MazE/SpoVT family DNA-binding domain-containing protein [Clostridia bacterium]